MTFEEIITDTYSGLKMYYRDTNIPNEFIMKYEIGQIIVEHSFVAMTANAGKPTKKVRYAIASTKAFDQSLRTPNAAIWSTFSLSQNSYFKVLDIYEIGNQTQVFILNIPEEHIEAFYGINTNIEKTLVEKARQSFEDKMNSEINSNLEMEQWVAMTEFPIGIQDNLELNKIRNIDTNYRDKLMGKNS
jgi:hypothetical protein